MKKILTTSVLLALAFTVVNALDPFTNFREGSCINAPPIRASREFMDTLKYMIGASRYNFYGMTAALPNYSSIREDHLYYDGCFTRNTTTSWENSTATVFGYGRPLVNFLITTHPGIYLRAVPTDPSLSYTTMLDTVTLTDHKNFAFVVQCFNVVGQRGWTLVTKEPYLDPRTRRIVEAHAVSLGFKKENFVFGRYDSCRLGLGNPDLEHVRSHSSNRRRKPVIAGGSHRDLGQHHLHHI